MITKDTHLPSYEELQVEECRLSMPYLTAGAFHLGKHCEAVNNEYMLCRTEEKDPRKCIEAGKAVTACTMDFFRMVKKNCADEFTDYGNCLDQSSTGLKMRYCRNTQSIFDSCMQEKLNMKRPHIGYFCESRLHETKRPKPPPPPVLVFPDALPEVPPPEMERKPAKYFSRYNFFN